MATLKATCLFTLELETHHRDLNIVPEGLLTHPVLRATGPCTMKTSHINVNENVKYKKEGSLDLMT